MKTPRRIVAATDFSQDAACALSRAKAIAAEHRAALALVHIINAPTLEAWKAMLRATPSVENQLVVATQGALDELAAGLARDGISITSSVDTGTVVDGLLAAAQSADLLVLGAHGANSLRDRILGTTAERLLGRCPIPMIVSRHPATAPYRRVLAAVDLSAYSAPALAAASCMAPRAELHVLHVYDVPFEGKLWLSGVADAVIAKHRGDVRTQALQQLHALVDEHLPGRPETLVAAAQGEAALGILEAASRYGADLVVIGKQGRSAIGDFFLGSVTRHVLADAECDVLVVPRPDAQQGT